MEQERPETVSLLQYSREVEKSSGRRTVPYERNLYQSMVCLSRVGDGHRYVGIGRSCPVTNRVELCVGIVTRLVVSVPLVYESNRSDPVYWWGPRLSTLVRVDLVSLTGTKGVILPP